LSRRTACDRADPITFDLLNRHCAIVAQLTHVNGPNRPFSMIYQPIRDIRWNGGESKNVLKTVSARTCRITTRALEGFRGRRLADCSMVFRAADSTSPTRQSKAGRGGKLALRWIGRDDTIRDFTYAALGAEVNRFANMLVENGLGKGDRVFSLLGRVPELYLAAFGTLKNASVFSPLFSAFGPEPIKARMTIGEAKALVTTEAFYRRKVEAWRKELPGLKTVLLNLSVLVTDAFMAAVRWGAEWPLVFPAEAFDDDGETIDREWSGVEGAVPCRVTRRVPARQLWESILRATYDCAEPGVLFIDRIKRMNNLSYRERISATNPCGEIPLPPYGACDLGSLNLTRFILSPFSPQARIDIEGLTETTRIAVRMLDNVIDASRFPLPEQAENARGSRRIGLGVTGLADALVMFGMTYGSERSLTTTAEVMRLICHTAYRASIALAQDKSSFLYLDRDKYRQGAFIRGLPGDIQQGIATHGIRNSHLIAIEPTGTISLLAGNVSSGLEPIFAASYTRKVLGGDGILNEFLLTDYALALWREMTGASDGAPIGFITAAELPVRAHLDMQAALHPLSTIQFPRRSMFQRTAHSMNSKASIISPMICISKAAPPSARTR
jgi:hypothetical protein